ncbi:hypothetical protein K438DRAFT_1759760 [Mycena galopus ATCC 62051]|nr:hypothetical protein K438DRAFT_1759760 [Mycena galopus ATCC 62051]
MHNQDYRTVPVHFDGVGFQRRLFAHSRDEGKSILSFNAYTKELTVVIHWMALESIRVVGSMILGESSIARVRPGTQGTRIRKSRADIGKYGHYLPREPKRCQREGRMMRVRYDKEGHIGSRVSGARSLRDVLAMSRREHRKHCVCSTGEWALVLVLQLRRDGNGDGERR